MSTRSPRPSHRSRPGAFAGRLLRAREGAVAVEFGMLALPFCFMIFAILEVALVFVIDSVLANATMETGRLVRTGQADNQNMTADDFRTALCDRMSIFSPDCEERATVDVREIPQFASAPPDPMADGEFDEGVLTYTNGEPGSLMVVRVWYRHTLITTFLAQGLSRMNDGTAILTTTTAFRNEPA